MAKRKYQRVVPVIGLLFLTILICALLLMCMEKAISKEEDKIIGRLFTAHPELEQELIGAFERPDGINAGSNISAGRALLKKYGYSEGFSGIGSQRRQYTLAILLVLFAAAVSIAGILAYNDRAQNKVHKEEMRAKEHMNELKDRNQVLLERLTKEEKETKALITDITHQLKTPLSSLKMSYEIAQSDKFTDDERNSFFKQGKEEINKLEALLEALLNLARLEKNMIQLKPEAAGIKKTLFAAVNSIYLKALDNHIDIITEEFADINVMHDIKWTQEAIVNVLDNAVKYSKPETKVRIKIEEMVSYILIEIADEGIGIPAKEQPNIFKRFYRGSNEVVKNSEGSGVGLYLVRKILEEQGGSVCVKSGISCGSIFQLTLPKA